MEKLNDLDDATLDASERVAERGARYAIAVGLQAEPLVASTFDTPSEAIVETADKLDAKLVVLGSRGRRGFKAALLGSTSTSVLHHARHPTLVVPSADVASARARPSH